MGVFERQTIKNNIFSFVAVAIGAYSQLRIYPLALEEVGRLQGLLKWSQLLVPFVVLGMTAVMLRYLPYLEGDRKNASNRLLSRSILVLVTSSGFFLGANFLIGDWVVNQLLVMNWNLGLLVNYRWHIIWLTIVLGVTTLLKVHLINFQRIAIPEVFVNIVPKVGLPLLVLFFVANYVDLGQLTWALVFLYALGALGLRIYAGHLNVIKLTIQPLGVSKKIRRQLIYLATFSVLGSIGSVLVVYLDTIAISTYLGDLETGIYSFAIFATTVMSIPFNAVNNLAGPVVAQSWKDKDMATLQHLYQETATVLFAVAGVIYVGTLVCLPYIYELTARPEDISRGYIAVVLLGGGLLFDQITSINGQLIGFTDYFRWNVVFIFMLGVLNLFLNYVFIVQWQLGLSGAALASAVSLFLYNLLKACFVYYIMRIHSLSSSLVATTLVLLISGLLTTQLIEFNSPVVNILLKGGFVCTIFLLYLRFTNAVPPLRRLLTSGFGQLF